MIWWLISTAVFFAALSFLKYIVTHALHPVGPPEKGVKRSSKDQPAADPAARKYPVIIVGGSSAGLTVAARLQQEKIPYLVLERNKRAGDKWRSRYDRVTLHTIKDVSNIPGFPFPEHFPHFVPRDLLADYYDSVAGYLDVRYSTEVLGTEFDAAGQVWKIRTRPAHAEPGAEEQEDTFEASALVICTGPEENTNVPAFKDADKYTGTLLHSAQFKNGEPFRGKKVLVVGAGNSGAEIALDLWEHDAHPTMLIRGSLIILPRWFARIFGLIHAAARHLPTKMHDDTYKLVYKPLLGDLSKYGLKIDPNIGLGTSILKMHTAWIDVGTLEQIKKGEILVANGTIDRFTSTGVVYNGREETYDAVVLATGFQPHSFATILPKEIFPKTLNAENMVRSGEEIDGKRLFIAGYSDLLGRLYEMRTDANKIIQILKEKRIVA